MRRILIIVENLPVPFDRRVWEEARTLRDAGYGVSIVCPTGKGFTRSRETIEGIAVYRYRLPLEAAGAAAYLVEYPVALAWQLLLAWRVFLTRGFDVIHACNPPDNILLVGLVFKLLFRRKFVFDHHDLCPELYLAKFNRRDPMYHLLRLFERMTFRMADISIATNDSYREIAIERGRMPADRVFVVRSGPSLERLQPVPPAPALRRGRCFLVGYVGVIGRQEGLQYLMHAIGHVVWDQGRRDIQFAVAGEGPDLGRIRRLAHELEVDEFVTFLGRIPDAELFQLLSTADLCVNPDEHNEMNAKSTMNKVMEYMTFGKPVVQFDLHENRVSAQAASLYARPNDAADLARKIVALISDPAARARMGRFGRRRIEEELCWNRQAPMLLAAYDRLWSR